MFDKIKCFNKKLTKPTNYEGNKKIIESMESSINELYPPSVKVPYPINYPVTFGRQSHFLDSAFNSDELTYAVECVNKKSAPGHDKISYEIIHALPDFISIIRYI